MNRMNPRVDEYLSKVQKWQGELEKLRTIVLDCKLTEELKWRQPCYTYQGKNVVIISGFKKYCGLMFFKGALLKDTHNILVKPGEHTQAGRLIRFTGIQEITEMEQILKAYITEAVEVEKAGKKVSSMPKPELKYPEEFQQKLDENPGLKTAFEKLTPGRRRAYILYFSGARQSKTRTSRVEKWMEHILNGKGLDDR